MSGPGRVETRPRPEPLATDILVLQSAGGPPLALHADAVHGARANVLIVPGLGDHAGRHLRTRAALSREGIGCYALDLRGHGVSGGKRRHVESFSQYLLDVEAALVHVERAAPRVPLFVLGHSMGALVAALYAVEGRHRPAALRGMVLSAGPFRIGVRVSPVTVAVGRFMSRHWPGFRIPTGINYEGLSRDPEAQAALRRDDQLVGWVTARLGAELLDAIAYAADRVGELDTPLLLAHGEADPITDPAGTMDVYRRAGAADKALALYPGCVHELHNEPPSDRERYLADVVRWITERS